MIEQPEVAANTRLSTETDLGTFLANKVAEQIPQKEVVNIENGVISAIEKEEEIKAPEIPSAPAVAEVPVINPVIEEKEEPLPWEEGDVQQTPIKQIEEVKDYKALYEQSMKELEDYKGDTFIGAYKSAKGAGKGVNAFLDEVKGEDPNKLTPEQLYTIDLKTEGLNEEQITQELEVFNEKYPTSYLKSKATKEIKEKLLKDQENILAKYSEQNKASELKMQEIGQKAIQEKQQYLDKLKGTKGKGGILMTPTVLSGMADYWDKFNIQREDGTFNVSEIMQLGYYKQNIDVMLKNAYERGKVDEFKSLNGGRIRASKDNGLANVPQVKNQQSQSDEANNSFLKEKASQGGGGFIGLGTSN